MSALKLGELFAGYGGLGLAVEEVFGAELAWYAEYDPSASKIMAHHWPDLTNYGDVTQVDWATVPPVDIISGGSPCQDLSTAGRRAGMVEGTRSNLWESMREAIATIQPTYVVWENVRGALSAKATSASDLEPREGLLGDRSGGHLRALGRVLGDLADLGYDCQWRGLRASDVGAPHGRFRIFILATRRDAPDSTGDAWRLLNGDRGTTTQDSLRGRSGRRPFVSGSSRGAWADAQAHGSDHRSGGADAAAQDAHIATRSQRWLAAPGQTESGRTRANTGRRGGTPAPDAGLHGRIRSQELHSLALPGREEGELGEHAHGHHLEDDRAGRRETPADAAGDGWDEGRAESEGQLGRPHAPLGSASTDWGPYEPAIRRWEAVRGTAPAPTELTPKGKHRLSPKLTEWMMGLPAGWVTNVPISRNDQLKACGNGVVPQQAAAALRHMFTAAHAAPHQGGVSVPARW
ncbi:MAG: DNA (cytosine-5-)-methyltransferase [Arthrobacter sp.]|nr:DNA (cytosine-5-)-methyltransferase [Arthrobacter sp.]